MGNNKRSLDRIMRILLQFLLRFFCVWLVGALVSVNNRMDFHSGSSPMFCYPLTVVCTILTKPFLFLLQVGKN